MTLVDTDILIDVLRGNSGAGNWLISQSDQWAISQITAMELIVGSRDKREIDTIETFLSRYRVIPVRASASALAYELLKTYSKSHGLQVCDALIAATAIDEGLSLASRTESISP